MEWLEVVDRLRRLHGLHVRVEVGEADTGGGLLPVEFSGRLALVNDDPEDPGYATVSVGETGFVVLAEFAVGMAEEYHGLLVVDQGTIRVLFLWEAGSTTEADQAAEGAVATGRFPG